MRFEGARIVRLDASRKAALAAPDGAFVGARRDPLAAGWQRGRIERGAIRPDLGLGVRQSGAEHQGDEAEAQLVHAVPFGSTPRILAIRTLASRPP